MHLLGTLKLFWTISKQKNGRFPLFQSNSSQISSHFSCPKLLFRPFFGFKVTQKVTIFDFFKLPKHPRHLPALQAFESDHFGSFSGHFGPFKVRKFSRFSLFQSNFILVPDHLESDNFQLLSSQSLQHRSGHVPESFWTISRSIWTSFKQFGSTFCPQTDQKRTRFLPSQRLQNHSESDISTVFASKQGGNPSGPFQSNFQSIWIIFESFLTI